MAASLTKLRLFAHNVFFVINTMFPPLLEALYAGTVKLFAEASRSSGTLCCNSSASSSAEQRPLMVSFKGTKRCESEGAKLGDEGEEIRGAD